MRNLPWEALGAGYNEAMDESDITRYITETVAGLDIVTATHGIGAGDTFFTYDPERNLDPKRRLPFATIVTKDYGDFDRASNLNRPGVFRLNIGLSTATYQSLFGPQPSHLGRQRCRRAKLG
ncbi:MAG: DUF6194 family protein [Chloroflexi bacterium]|nr:DUF6194 family protein [Chloroflexota bacterium]